MSVELLNAKLNVRSALKQYKNKAEMVPITPDLLKRASAANAAYKTYLEEKKEKEQQAKRKLEEETRIQKEEEERKKEIIESKKSLQDLEKDLASKKVIKLFFFVTFIEQSYSQQIQKVGLVFIFFLYQYKQQKVEKIYIPIFQ